MAENDSLLREIDDAVRQERMMGLWNHLKMPLIYAAVALIVVTAGSSVWNSYQKSQAEKITLAFDAARAHYVAARYEEAAKSFDALAHQTRGDMADMVKLWRARSLLAFDKKKTALRVLQNIVLAPEGHDLFWRDMACLHVLGQVKSTAEVPEGCSGEKPSPLSAVLVQFRAAGKWSEGEAKAAEVMLEKLADNEQLSPNVRAQGRALETTIRTHAKKE